MRFISSTWTLIVIGAILIICKIYKMGNVSAFSLARTLLHFNVVLLSKLHCGSVVLQSQSQSLRHLSLVENTIFAIADDVAEAVVASHDGKAFISIFEYIISRTFLFATCQREVLRSTSTASGGDFLLQECGSFHLGGVFLYGRSH